MYSNKETAYVFGDDLLSKRISNKLKVNNINILPNNFDSHDKKTVKEFFIKNKPKYVILDANKDTDGELQNYIAYNASLNGAFRIIKFNNFRHQKELSPLIINVNYDVYYSENDDYSEDSNNIISQLIRDIHNAKIYGNNIIHLQGDTKKMNVIYIDDLVNSIIFLLRSSKIPYNNIQIHNCCEMTIMNISSIIKDVIGYEGDIVIDVDEKPIYSPRLLSINDLGWRCKYELQPTIRKIYFNQLVDKHKYFMVSSIVTN